MADEVWQQATEKYMKRNIPAPSSTQGQGLPKNVASETAAALLAFFFRTPGQPAFRLLRASNRQIVLAEEIEKKEHSTTRYTYIAFGEGLLVITNFSDGHQLRNFLDTNEMAREIVRINPAITAEQLMAHVRQELDAIAAEV